MALPSVSEADFRARLEAAVEQRARTFTNHYTLHVHFQNDDTRADRDADNFKTICAAFGLPQPHEIIIKPTDPSPSWTIQGDFTKMLTAARQAPGRSLVMVHYAGHGSLNHFDRLIFQANQHEPRSVQFADAFLNHVSESSDFTQHDPDVDVVMIIDSCCSGAATRTISPQIPRVVEILAACKADASALGNQLNTSIGGKVRIQNRTFSAKLADIVAKQKGKGEPLSFAEMMGIIDQNSPKIKPFYELLLGSASIRLPFPTQSLTAATKISPSAEAYRAVFSVHLSGALTNDALQDLVKWIRTLDLSMDIKVDAVYQTNSVGLIIEAPFHVYAQLNSLQGIRLVFENTTGNKLPHVNESLDLSRLSLVPLKENVKASQK
ncbi:hypothetical protein FQN55_001383 [Onygenales sp. PD_40]|nr:hypothetical protein FQN55_001383 [Onygenales sp. PD_40]KAK2777033.1 hypothetical protein FQN52_003260 [Onygenales sp. PD_12]KAK2779330.1 hypothetical protein FQN53_001400 [Emmonsiellopsis sp. PD_33]KAK2807182.1 hypothetical protein FQN51_004796 [Onygenales sp. PD_10]